MTELEQYIYTKLDAMQTEKAKQPIHPNMVTKAEFFAAVNKDVRNVLNKLYIEKRLKVHQTIHSSTNDYIELVKNN